MKWQPMMRRLTWKTPPPRRRRKAHAFNGWGWSFCGALFISREDAKDDPGIPNEACVRCQEIADIRKRRGSPDD